MHKAGHALCLLLLLSCLPDLLAQPELIWVRQLGARDNLTSAPSDKGTGIVTDAEGNVYVTGNFWGKADFDPGPGTYYLQSAGVSDIFVCKLSATGHLVWAKRFGGQNYHNSNSIALDKTGHLYITGSMQGTTTFSPEPSQPIQPSGYKDAYVCKLDTAGNLIWVNILGGIPASMDQNEGMSVAADDSGNVYSLGMMYYAAGGIDLDPGPEIYYLSSTGDFDIYLSKLNANGEFIWGRKVGGTNRDFGKALCLDQEGNVYFTGSFKGKVDFDPGNGTFFLESSAGREDGFLCSYDRFGNFAWARRIGGQGSATGNSLVIQPEGNLVLAGEFSGTVDFDPDTGSFTLSGSNSSTFITKYSTAGQFKWAKHFSGRNNARGVASDPSGNIYLTGGINAPTNTPTDFDPDTGQYLISLPYNSPDIYIAKLDSNGKFISAGTLGGASAVAVNTGFAVAADASQNLYVTGQYMGSAPDFDPDRTPGAVKFMPTTSMDDEDIFVGKYGTMIKPLAGFQSNKQAICAKECIFYSDKSVGAETWSWWFEGGEPAESTQQQPGPVCYNEPGNYAVRLIVQRSGLSDTLEKESHILVDAIQASFYWVPDNLSYHFFSSQDSLPGMRYLWQFGDGSTSNMRNPVHVFEGQGPFEVCLYLGLEDACRDSSCESIEMLITNSGHPNVQPAMSWFFDPVHLRVINQACEGKVEIRLSDLSGKFLMQPSTLFCDNGSVTIPYAPENEYFLIHIREGKSYYVVPGYLFR
jgi:PKD repeat protein